MLMKRLEDRNPTVDFWITKRDGLLKLTYLAGDKVGAFMGGLCSSADELGKIVAVDATQEMESFYIDYRFVKNAGRHKDSEIDERMYRKPE